MRGALGPTGIILSDGTVIYTTPDAKEFVSDGVKMYSYIPQDKQVYVSSVPQVDQASTPALFLSGKGNLARDFTASAADVPAGELP